MWRRVSWRRTSWKVGGGDLQVGQPSVVCHWLGVLAPLELDGLIPLELGQPVWGVCWAPLEMAAANGNHSTLFEPPQGNLRGGQGTSPPTNQSGYRIVVYGWR